MWAARPFPWQLLPLLFFLSHVATVSTLFPSASASSPYAPAPRDDTTGKSSLTFVFDITGSMFDDLMQVREGSRKIFQTVMQQREKLIYNYIMVPFHDPHLGEIIKTTDSNYFLRQLGKIYVHGGGDCQEPSLSGIKKALEISLPSSFIYVFTDARSKDYHLEDEVLNLIQEKQSSVVFVMTGDCGNRTHPGFRTYEKIAAASFGQVFHLQKSDVSTVLEYVRHSVQQKKVHLMYEVREKGGTVIKKVPVDKHMTELTLSLSGDKDDEDILDISLQDPAGNVVDKNAYNRGEGNLDLKNVKLIRMKDPLPGEWQIITNARLKNTIRVFGHGTIDFKYGFASRPMDKIELTRPRPVANQNTYLLINMTGLIPPGTVSEIVLLDYYGNVLHTSSATPHRTNHHMYFTGPFTPPKGLFFIKVKGVDEEDYAFERIAPTAIGSVTVGGPRAYMTPSQTAFIGKDVNLTCTVESPSPFTIYWKRSNQVIGGPLFYPMTETSIWTLPEITLKDSGDYECLVVSENGNHSVKTYLETRESPPFIIGMRNESVPTGYPAFLHCPTQSTTKSEIRWLRHGHSVLSGPNTRIYPNGTLRIHVASPSDSGYYECQARNTGGMASQTLFLKVLRLPKAAVHPSVLYFAPGTAFNISCLVEGDPQPTPQWFFNGRKIEASHKYYITYKNDLIVRSASREDAGSYECRAVSTAGQHGDSATVQLATPPRISLTQSKTMVGRGDSVTFDCRILDGFPTPTIQWMRNGRELLKSSHEYMHIDGGRLTIMGVQDSDSGSYQCIAESIAGRVIESLKLEVGSMPSIVPSPETVHVNIEKPVTLQCRAIGHPSPTISWSRDGVPVKQLNNPRYTILPDGNLHISSALMEDQSSFTCTATNNYGTQSKTTTVRITGLVSPVLGHVPPEEQLIEGKDLRLSCIVVLGTPLPQIQWFKDGKPVETGESVIVEGGGSSLLLRKGNPKDEGRYECRAVSPAGTATLHINVQLIKRPEFDILIDPTTGKPMDEIGQKGVSAKEGQSLEIPCKVRGTPEPAITWSFNGRPISREDNRYTIKTDNTLVVHTLDKSTGGQYTCNAVNIAGDVEQTTAVTVISIPIIQPSQGSFNVIQGSPVTIPCDVFIEPKPEIKWYLNGKEFTDGTIGPDGSLTIETVDEVYKGELKCVSKNLAGTDEKVVQLTVHTAPIVEGSGQIIMRTANMNDTVTLPCPAHASPPPVRIWSYESQKIDSMPILHDITGDGNLVLHSVQLDAAGHYTCLVSNLAGDDSITYQLEVQEKPRVISDTVPAVDVVKGMTLELPCKAVGTPPPVRMWEKDGIRVIEDEATSIDTSGTLKITKTEASHGGVYTCVLSNAIGEDRRDTNVIVQEPPVILPTTISNYTSVEGDQVELQCHVEATPAATIQWMRKGVPVTESTQRVHIEEDGTLVIEEVSKEDSTFFTCKASNSAGKAEKVIQLNVISPPDIPEPDVVVQESVKVDQPFSLYCPVFGTPMPTIGWQLNDVPISESDLNYEISEDRRRLHFVKARPSDSGIYKCIARNLAGEGSKTFEVEVLVPLNLNETIWQKKVTAKEGEFVELGCPVYGFPVPDINWIVNGRILKQGEEIRGIKLGDNGQTIVIDEAKVEHDGQYHCYAQSKAGSFDVDIDLKVLAPPRIGKDESLEMLRGKAATLSCEVENDLEEKSIIKWTFNDTQPWPENVQIPLDGQRAFLVDAAVENTGVYVCVATNSAGSSTKKITITVIEPPEFVEKDYVDNVQVNSGNTVPLSCIVKGTPRPVIEWRRDGQTITTGISDNGQRITVEAPTATSRLTCLVTNKGGSISRDFFVKSVSAPTFSDTGVRTVVEVTEGQTATLECPAEGDDFEIVWRRQGKKIDAKDAIFALDKKKLVIINAKKEHEDTFTCLVKNAAGEATREFEVIVLVPPNLKGGIVEDIELIEGEELRLNCENEGDPTPKIEWKKVDNGRIPLRAQMLFDNSVMVLNEVKESEGGVFSCTLSNKVGVAEKTFNVKVIAKPHIDKDATDIHVNVSRPISLDCGAKDVAGDVSIVWRKEGIDIKPGEDSTQISSGGRYLHIPSATVGVEGTYQCVQSNKAGEGVKEFKVVVQVPPSIMSEGGEFSVTENSSLVLPCVVSDSRPKPTITWTKDGRPIDDLKSVEILSEGQQFKIIHADLSHKGSYICQAKSDVGSAELSFDVDVITRPTVVKGIKDTIEVIEGETAHFKCPIADTNFNGEIIWLNNYQPIDFKSNKGKYSLAQQDRRLNIIGVTPRDEGVISCRAKNEAGESRVDIKLVVLVPPKIIILDSDKNRSVVENSSLTLSCPATGNPEPTIVWMKDGEVLHPTNVSQLIKSASYVGNEIKIARIKDIDSGRFTCEASNRAGRQEMDVLVNVITPPKIEKDGIPSDIAEEVGKSVTLTCPAQGKPPPVVKWFKAGRVVGNDDPNIKVSPNGQKLYFMKLRKEDAGRFTCTVLNSAGEAKRDFSIKLLEPPSFKDPNIMKRVEVNAGRPVELQCPAEGSPPPVITWLRDGIPLTASSRHIFLDGGKQLQISNTQAADKGRYTCLATNSIGAEDLQTELNVITPPTVIGDSHEKLEVIEGHRISLDCEVNETESSPVEIEWQHLGETIQLSYLRGNSYVQIPSSGKKLSLLSARQKDAGRWSCILKNQAGEARKTFDLKVLVPASINEESSTDSLVTAVPHTSVSLTCDVEGDPTPQIIWKHNGVEIREDDEKRQLTNQRETLRIESIEAELAGTYRCEASNKPGQASRDFVVRMSGPPVFDKGHEKQDVAVGDSVVLTCKVDEKGSGNAEVKWMKEGKYINNGQLSSSVEVMDRTIKVTNAQVADSGEFVCVATNDAGEARKKFELSVLEAPRFLDTSNTNSSIVIGRDLLLDCSVAGTPKPLVKWFKNEKEIGEADLPGATFLNDKQQLRIEEAKADDAGLINCIAENKMGKAEKNLIVTILQPPKMTSKFVSKEVVKGEQLTMECPIDDPTVDVTWTKNGNSFSTSERIQFSENRKKLFILVADEMDSAQYVCRAVNEAGEDSATFDTTVNVSPRILGPSSRSLDVLSNQTVDIDCQVEGTPAPSIVWLYNGKPIVYAGNTELLDDGKKLRLNKILVSQEGRYTCRAENIVDRVDADTYLSIAELPRVLMQSEEMKVVLGKSITIRCEVFGNPEPEVEWLKDGNPYEFQQKSKQLTSILISPAALNDSGRYTCSASNRAGNTRASTQLHVLVAPVIPDGERIIQAKENGSVTIDCSTPDARPPATYTWRKDGVLLEGKTGGTLTLTDLKSSDVGKVSCAAENEAGIANADFALEIHSRPKFKELVTEIKVIEGEKARIECRVEGHPTPEIRWLKGGRGISSMSNIILSPRGETLMILKAQRSDGGGVYSCVAKNSAGESEATFTVTVLTPPHMDEPVDQNPKVIVGRDVTFFCPVLGNPQPKVEWLRDGTSLKIGGRYSVLEGKHLKIAKAVATDNARYTCKATNEAGELQTQYEPKMIAKPKFNVNASYVYEVVENAKVTMECNVTSETKPEIDWFRNGDPLYISDNTLISSDGTKLTIQSVSLQDAGPYQCKVSNEAGSSEIDMILKILVPPKIDKSNIIGNPLAIVDRPIYLECPVDGIPPPTIVWLQNDKPINYTKNGRFVLAQSNQTLGLEPVRRGDEAVYTCVATNKGGSVREDFKLEVLVPPVMDVNETQKQTKREGEKLLLQCPIKTAVDMEDAVSDVSWLKDGRPIDPNITNNVKISRDGRQLTINVLSRKDTGLITCVAINRAGESSADFKVDVLSPPTVDESKINREPFVTIGKPVELSCPAFGDPPPSIRWTKNGEIISEGPGIRFSDNGRTMIIEQTKAEHEGIFECVAQNDAGVSEPVSINLHVWIPPSVKISTEGAIKRLDETVTLLCSATGNPTPTLSWVREGQPIIHSPEGIRISQKGARLDIPHLKKSDIGEYVCQAINEAGSATTSIQVDVLVPPEIKRNVEMEPRGLYGQSVILRCDVEGRPQPNIKWLLNGTEISDNSEKILISSEKMQLTISNLTLADKGIYSCHAENTAGTDTLEYNVDVIRAPVILNGGNQQVVEGELARIECQVQGHPEPHISWLRNGIRIDTGVQGVRYIVDGKILSVLEARSSDSGIYVCEAVNEGGRAQQAYTLEILVSPKIVNTTAANQSIPSGVTFSLICGARGYPEPEIAWTVDGETISKGNEAYAIADDGSLKVAAASGRLKVFECTAKNNAGVDTFEYNIQAISAPQITKEGERSVNASEGQPAEMSCGVEAEDADVKWTKNGLPLLPTAMLSMSEDKKKLSISSARLSDEGEYKCTIENKAGNASLSTTLNVGVPPQIVERPLSEIVKKGDTVTLWCEATGVPQPNIIWKKNGEILTKTAIEENSDKRRKSAIFASISPEEAGIYTCEANNWAGKTSIDVDLVVMIPPEIIPEKMNISTDPRQIVFLSCNATGNPEPMISWVRVPNIQITPNEKYQLLGTSLAIRNVLPEDEGFYHCIAKSESGQTIAQRRLIVNKPQDKLSQIWVECDENGKPIITEYMLDRGDSPDDNPQLLPWKETEDVSLNATNGIVYRCLPGSRSPRYIVFQNAPSFVIRPRNRTVKIGRIVDLKCSAVGPPTPLLFWTLDGEALSGQQGKGEQSGYSALKTVINQTGHFNLTCHAQNSAGLGTASAIIHVVDEDYDLEGSGLPADRIVTEGSGLEMIDYNVTETQDSVIEMSMSTTELKIEEETMCAPGYEKKDGECLLTDENTLPKEVAVEDNQCPEGYQRNGELCEDINECNDKDAHVCEYRCINSKGGYDCACPEGYFLNEDLECIDVDECVEEVRCGEMESCFNQYGNFSCIEDPCPENYTSVNNRYCAPDCDDCGLHPISIQMLALPSGLPKGTQVAELRAFDKHGRIIEDSYFTMWYDEEGLSKNRTRVEEFSLRPGKPGSVKLHTSKILSGIADYELRVRATSSMTNAPRETNFLVIINVGKYPF